MGEQQSIFSGAAIQRSRRLLRCATLVMGLILIVLGWPGAQTSARIIHRPGDWVSYTMSRFINAIAYDQEYVYFATTGGISRYQLNQARWSPPLTTSDGLADNWVNVVAADRYSGDLWCGTRAGVSRYQPAFESWTTFPTGGGELLREVVSIGVGQTFLLFETPTSLIRYNRNSGLWEVERGDVSGARIEWHGQRSQMEYQGPDFIMDMDYNFIPPNYIQDRYLRRFRLTAFLNDDRGNIWFGTWGLNVARGSLRSLRLEVLPFGLMQTDVRAMGFAGQDIWFGGLTSSMQNAGITRYTPRIGEWTYFEARYLEGLASNQITSLAVDSSTVWFGSPGMVSRYDKNHRRWRTYRDPRLLDPRVVTALAVTPGRLWIGTDRGLLVMDTQIDSLAEAGPPRLKQLVINDLMVAAGHLWVATQEGVYRYTWDGEWTQFEEPNGLISGNVTRLATDAENYWFTTLAGLVGYNRLTQRWERHLGPVAFSRVPVFDLVAHRKRVWVGTGQGALWFNPVNGNWRLFTEQDGLLDDRVQAILPDRDYIWFGTPNGVTRFLWNDPRYSDY